MNKRAKPLTVPQLAKHAGVSERTVWYDIKAGRLRVRRLRNGRVVIPRSALRSYRGGARDRLLTIQDLVKLTPCSDRTIRRRIQSGQLPALHVSPRRLLVREKDAPRLFGVYFEIYANQAERLAREARKREHERERQRDDELAYAQAERLGLFRRSGKFGPILPFLLKADEVAQLSGKTVRQVYHDIEKGALVAIGWSSRDIRVHWRDLIRYLLP